MCSDNIFNLDKTKIYTILMTCAPGLEQLVSQQISNVLPSYVPIEIKRGKVVIRLQTTLRHLQDLRCVDNLYLVMNTFTIGHTKNDLNKIVKAIAMTDFSVMHSILEPVNRKLTISASASRTGKHNYTRLQAADITTDALLLKKHFILGAKETSDLYFRLDIEDRTARLSLKLTSASFKFRNKFRAFVHGAIRPSIANTLVWLSNPKSNDVFLDPFCGSGTIVAEREAYAVRKILAADISDDAILAAYNNTSSQVIILNMDARNLKIAKSSITSIVTNLPWDVQIKTEDIGKLYYDFLGQAVEILTEDGNMIVLTDKEKQWIDACNAYHIAVEKLAVISLHGLHPAIYRMAGFGNSRVLGDW